MNKNLKHLVVTVALACLPVLAAAQQKIAFAGSSTIMPLIESLQPTLSSGGIATEVQGGGSGAGIRSLRMGMAQIAMASRDLTEAESKEFRTYTMAQDIVVLIANSGQHLSNLSTAEVKAIYSGEKRQWADGSGINVISKESGRATKEVFDAHFNMAGRVRKDAVIIGSNGQAISSVASDKRAIGYVSYSAARQAILDKEPIRILSLDGVTPTFQHVRDGSYMLRRGLNLVYKAEFQKDMDRVIQVLKSKASAEQMLRAGVLPTGA